MSARSDRPEASAADSPTDRPVRDIIDRLEATAQTDTVKLKDLLEACGIASFVPTLMVPALLVVSPLSGIPLFSSACGITIVFIAAQMLFKREYLYLPGALTRRTVPGDKLRAGLKTLRRGADFIDQHTQKGRLGLLVGHGGRILPQAFCVIAGALMPLLELLPFSSSILGAAVLCFSIALLTRDGLFVLIGMAIFGAAAAVPIIIL